MNRVQQALGFTNDQYAEWTAVHEIGHAIAGEHGGMRIKTIQLDKVRGQLHGGRVTFAPHSDVHVNLVAAHGGHIAQELWMRKLGLWSSYRMDIVSASSRRDLDVIARFAPSAQAAARAEQDARRALDLMWPRVAAATKALVAKQKMSGRQFGRIH